MDHAFGTSPKEPLLAAAEETARGLLESVEGRADTAAVTTDVRSFRGVAAIMSRLLGEVKSCGGQDCMGRSVDGVKLWVTQDQLEQTRVQLAQAEAVAAHLQLSLQRIRDLDLEGAADRIFFDDWQALVSQLRSVAGEALNAAQGLAQDEARSRLGQQGWA